MYLLLYVLGVTLMFRVGGNVSHITIPDSTYILINYNQLIVINQISRDDRATCLVKIVDVLRSLDNHLRSKERDIGILFGNHHSYFL